MSSKFNQRPFRRRRPPICVAPPKPPHQTYPRRLPPRLTGFAQWTDLDPAGEQNAAAVITTGPRSPTGLYTGQRTFGDVILGIRIQDQAPAPAVDVTITYEDPLWGPLSFTWPNVPMPNDKYFDTHLLTTTLIPVTDLRRARFME